MQKMHRIATWPVAEFLPWIGEGCTVTHEGIVGGTSSLRMRTFKEKGTDCVVCGIKGTFFALECQEYISKKDGKTVKHGSYHVNLYAQRDDGSLRLLTHDHIFPTAHGGCNTMKNSTTMCEKCNNNKGSKMPTNEFVAVHGGETGPYRELVPNQPRIKPVLSAKERHEARQRHYQNHLAKQATLQVTA